MTEKTKTNNPVNLKDIPPFEALPGIYRQTLAYNSETMLCVFHLKKNAEIPLHNHPNVQIGFIISGKIKFLSDDFNREFIASTGDSYVFEADERHGAKVLEETRLIEVFYPYRPEYKPI
ncbi:MAG: cupin domain-containing protein [Candidatus Lokiarchaeota archaeon]|nr:cupin domain-containing protein [Candidatus Lokiarchaeota archaeon]